MSEPWDLVIVVGGDGTVLRQSTGVKGVLGYSTGALVVQNVLEYIHPPDAAEGKTAFCRAIESQRAFAENERRFRAIVEGSLEIVKVVSTSGVLLYANPAF